MTLTDAKALEDGQMQQQTTTTRKPWVRHGQHPHTVNLESQTTAGRFYTVTLRGTPQCSCPAGKHNRICWHLGVAQAFVALRVVESAAARSAGMAALQALFA